MNDQTGRDKDVYSFFRDEIKRDDEITHHRMTTCMAFQGFLFAAQTFLISGAWTVSTAATRDGCENAFDVMAGCNVALVQNFRVAAIAAIGFVGYAAALASLAGIIAARLSIRDVKRHFETLLDGENADHFFKCAPQIHGRAKAFKLGNGYTIAVPFLIALVWSIYLGAYVGIVLNRPIEEAVGAGTSLVLLLLALLLIFQLDIPWHIFSWKRWKARRSTAEESGSSASSSSAADSSNVSNPDPALQAPAGGSQGNPD